LVLATGVAVSAEPAAYAAALAGALVGFLAAVAHPRWTLVLVLFLLVGYIPDVVGGGGLPAAASALPCILAGGVVTRHMLRIERVAVPKEAIWYGCLLGAFLLALATAREANPAVSEIGDVAGFAVLAVTMFVLVDSITWLRRAMAAIVAAIGALAVLAVMQQVRKSYGETFGGFATVEVDARGVRTAGPLSANYFAELLTAATLLAVYLAAASRSRAARFATAALAVAMLAALVYTLSRAGLVALIVGCVIAGALRHVRPAVMGATAFTVIVVGLAVLPASTRERLSELSEVTSAPQSTDSSLRGRLSENIAALDMFADHPLFGVGPGNYELAYPAYAERTGLDSRPELRSAHNLYLESLAETGVFGSVTFFGLLAFALRQPLRERRRLRGTDMLLVEGCFVALAAFLVCAITLHLSYPRYLWTFVALAIVAGRVAKHEATA
jgi:O-antigen ligase